MTSWGCTLGANTLDKVPKLNLTNVDQAIVVMFLPLDRLFISALAGQTSVPETPLDERQE